mmetsp:Transcript_80250/g.238983  ORF Transcript_80250/g.238983 Transcript_80250/m.238983 type:complete len:210 (-) Transcript_80250:329-958(-)
MRSPAFSRSPRRLAALLNCLRFCWKTFLQILRCRVKLSLQKLRPQSGQGTSGPSPPAVASAGKKVAAGAPTAGCDSGVGVPSVGAIGTVLNGCSAPTHLPGYPWRSGLAAVSLRSGRGVRPFWGGTTASGRASCGAQGGSHVTPRGDSSTPRARGTSRGRPSPPGGVALGAPAYSPTSPAAAGCKPLLCSTRGVPPLGNLTERSSATMP